jgi:hypothetical protein
MGFSFKKLRKAANFVVAPIKLGVTAPLKAVTWAAAQTGAAPLKKADRFVGKEVKRDVANTITHLKVGAAVGGSILASRAAGAVKGDPLSNAAPTTGLAAIAGDPRATVAAPASTVAGDPRGTAPYPVLPDEPVRFVPPSFTGGPAFEPGDGVRAPSSSSSSLWARIVALFTPKP